jgi:hypothetical protein
MDGLVMSDKKRVLSEWELLCQAITGKHAKRMNAVLETLVDEDFMIQYPKLLEFVVPKITRTELDDQREEQVIKVIHVSAEDERLAEANSKLADLGGTTIA